MKELELEVDLVFLDMKNREHKSAAYMQLNPHGTSPTLVLPDGLALWESSAIIYHVLDNYDTQARLKGTPGSTVRTQFHLYQAFAAEAESTMIAYFIQTKMMPEAKRDPALIASKKAHWEQKLVSFYERLVTSPEQQFAVGNDFSAVDIAITYSLHLANVTDLLQDKPTLRAYADKMSQRPQFESAFEGSPV